MSGRHLARWWARNGCGAGRVNCSPCCLEAVRVGLPEDQLKVATCARAQSRISSVAASWPVIRARIAFSTGLLGKGGGARRSSAAHLTRFQPPVEWGPASAKHSTLGRIEGEVGRPGGHGGRRSREVPGIALRSRQMRVQAFQPSALVTGSCPKRRPRRSAESAPRRSEC